MAKRKTETTKTSVSKKYNQDADTVPIYPSGFSLGSNDKDDLKILEFFFTSTKNNKRQDIDLGSYVLSNRMANELADMIKKSLNDKKEIIEW